MVGKIRFHTVHTNRKKCKSPDESIQCYEIELSHAHTNKSHLGDEGEWQRYRTAEEVNDTYRLQGDYIMMTGDGYTFDFDPNITVEQFRAGLSELQQAYIQSEDARGLVILVTTYSVRTDWWLSNYAFFEYGINEQVRVSQIRSYPFKPNFYETATEKQLL